MDTPVDEHQSNQSEDVRPSPIAGQWYPGSFRSLTKSIEEYLSLAGSEKPTGKIVAVIAPHAGHLYSGPVAGHAFAPLRGKSFDLVAVISPMHYGYPYAFITTAHEAYATPLGTIRVDRAGLKKLETSLHQRTGDRLHAVRQDPEHSLEIELPFLQCALEGSFELLPVMVREVAPHPLQGLGLALADVLRDRKALLVASSDLSHFYTQEQARRYDLEMLRRIESFDPMAVLEAEEQGKGFACGRAAIAAVMWAARELGATQAKTLHYATSGDVTGDHSRVVGYGAAIIVSAP